MVPTACYKYSAILALALCLSLPVLRFFGLLEKDSYEIAFLLASAAWFLAATIWSARRKKAAGGAGPAGGAPAETPPACGCSDCCPPAGRAGKT